MTAEVLVSPPVTESFQEVAFRRHLQECIETASGAASRLARDDSNWQTSILFHHVRGLNGEDNAGGVHAGELVVPF